MTMLNFVEVLVDDPAIFTSNPVAAFKLIDHGLTADQIDDSAGAIIEVCAQTMKSDGWKVSIFRGQKIVYDTTDPDNFAGAVTDEIRDLWVLFYNVHDAATFRRNASS